MESITKQLLICLVMGFFICGIHCELVPYPKPAICESDNDCLEKLAKCIRRECHCTSKHDVGDGKTFCTKWKACSVNLCKSLKNKNQYGDSHCLTEERTGAVTCKCNPGYFGHTNTTGCRSSAKRSGNWPYPCLTRKNCPTYSHCYPPLGTCICPYELTGNGETCERSPIVQCSHDRTCKAEEGFCYDGTCRCPRLYAGNGDYCRETKPCPKGFECGRNSVCFVDYQLFPNDPVCECELGTEKKDGKCTDCSKDADCSSDILTCQEGFCTCIDGLATAQNKSCEPGPLHPCNADSDCHSRAKCDIGKCFCQGKSTGNGKYCRDSLPCPANHQCDENYKCVVDPLIPDKPHCVCLDGFRRIADGTCIEITECFRRGQECPIDQVCSEVYDGSYECICYEGYEKITSEGESTCQDYDECSDPGTCPANSDCVNTDGSYDCECRDGYTKNGDGSCEDVDECSEIVDACSVGETCMNAQGGYSCECKQGYFKKDGACVEGECKCKKHEECREGQCKCKKGYKKNKKGHCVSPMGRGLRGRSAQVSGYLSTFILGVLGSLALTA